jgi:hypothetical protein
MKDKEDSHTKNLASFREIIAQLLYIEPEYQPTYPEIGLENLLAFDENLKTVIVDINNAEALHEAALQIRYNVFNLSSIIPRILENFTLSEKEDQHTLKVNAVIKKIKKSGLVKKNYGEQSKENTHTKIVKEISQTRIDNCQNNFSQLIELLRKSPKYTPKEKDLTLNALTLRLNQMGKANKKVIQLRLALDQMRGRRNKLLYEGEMSAIDLSKRIKRHIKNLYNSKDHRYKKISMLKLRKIKY